MGLLDSVLKVFVGDKSKKDISDIQPYVDKVKKYEASLEKLTLDELRAKSDAFRQKIKEDQKEIQLQIDQLQMEAEAMEDIDKKEDIYNLGLKINFGIISLVIPMVMFLLMNLQMNLG